MTSKTRLDLIVFSHLRWDFVFQRPHHLLTRCAQHRRVYFVEEPVFEPDTPPTLHVSARGERLFVAVPHLPSGRNEAETNTQLRHLVDELVRERLSSSYIAWYYTPMPLEFTRHLKPVEIIYDCMDELSNFKFAPPELCLLENELFQRAHVVFTGGVSLYENKRHKHANVHPFPSSVDVAHFRTARTLKNEPADQSEIPRPRIGYAGVIDERLDIDLIRGVAEARPDWQLVLIGPVVKIDPETLPRLPNIHYLGGKAYKDLPNYLSGWDVAMMPFARNDATRFISPTKTPEYLAAGRRVVSTSIRDVVRTYGEAGLVKIADGPESCVAAIEASLSAQDGREWLHNVDAYLSKMSWDETFLAMWQLIEDATEQPSVRRVARAAGRLSVPSASAAALSAGVPLSPSS
jgi:UDP-galactopyranose mutase